MATATLRQGEIPGGGDCRARAAFAAGRASASPRPSSRASTAAGASGTARPSGSSGHTTPATNCAGSTGGNRPSRERLFLREMEWAAAQSCLAVARRSASMRLTLQRDLPSKQEARRSADAGAGRRAVRGGERIALLGSGGRPSAGHTALNRSRIACASGRQAGVRRAEILGPAAGRPARSCPRRSWSAISCRRPWRRRRRRFAGTRLPRPPDPGAGSRRSGAAVRRPGAVRGRRRRRRIAAQPRENHPRRLSDANGQSMRAAEIARVGRLERVAPRHRPTARPLLLAPIMAPRRPPAARRI